MKLSVFIIFILALLIFMGVVLSGCREQWGAADEPAPITAPCAADSLLNIISHLETNNEWLTDMNIRLEQENRTYADKIRVERMSYDSLHRKIWDR